MSVEIVTGRGAGRGSSETVAADCQIANLHYYEERTTPAVSKKFESIQEEAQYGLDRIGKNLQLVHRTDQKRFWITLDSRNA